MAQQVFEFQLRFAQAASQQGVRLASSAMPISLKYNFYHPYGDGRDGFICHASAHQTGFNYVPKAPECTLPAAAPKLSTHLCARLS